MRSVKLFMQARARSRLDLPYDDWCEKGAAPLLVRYSQRFRQRTITEKVRSGLYSLNYISFLPPLPKPIRLL